MRNRERISGTLEVLSDAGEAVARQALETALERVRDLTNADHVRGRDLLFEDRLRQVLSFVDPGLPARIERRSLDRIRTALDGPFLTHPPRLFPGVPEVLNALIDRGVTLAIVSNTGFTSPEGYDQLLEGHGIRHLFKVISLSNGRGLAKPDAAFFRVTLDALGVSPAAALHVGDDLNTDVAGGHRAGLSTVWLSGIDTSRPETQPDFTISEIGELPDIVERWLSELRSAPRE